MPLELINQGKDPGFGEHLQELRVKWGHVLKEAGPEAGGWDGEEDKPFGKQY